MSQLLRLDHVAVVVRDTEVALEYFTGRLGLQPTSTEVLTDPPVRLTYLDCGNAFIQLVEPLEAGSAIADRLAQQGEGLHHICFGVEEADKVAAELADTDSPEVTLGQGRGQLSVFVPGKPHHGVLVECTNIDGGGGGTEAVPQREADGVATVESADARPT